ncbi:MAG: hypothetical protein A3D56_01460 [Candidatus Taylorbacteria bacterium RIFCSPHIGHO2_02_FULL_45_35]|uniref:Uncharacterized protein n=1 Tax=Candidatus Taylorbacteria bacterium RIFCSPHIGHO2_02_FULL_45_35 TaxID=1802311 RepID=A0A1G2MVI4_9BACT|nr:MAG: hypothetical protein A3D56_01460 [Candidatus Taylorbacteria bacterium RIFCSPHIGHO2_02_FULL_45_35]
MSVLTLLAVVIFILGVLIRAEWEKRRRFRIAGKTKVEGIRDKLELLRGGRAGDYEKWVLEIITLPSEGLFLSDFATSKKEMRDLRKCNALYQARYILFDILSGRRESAYDELVVKLRKELEKADVSLKYFEVSESQLAGFKPREKVPASSSVVST